MLAVKFMTSSLTSSFVSRRLIALDLADLSHGRTEGENLLHLSPPPQPRMKTNARWLWSLLDINNTQNNSSKGSGQSEGLPEERTTNDRNQLFSSFGPRKSS